jgi:hypothetical protein
LLRSANFDSAGTVGLEISMVMGRSLEEDVPNLGAPS